jgi:hypothetical protein
MTAISIDPRLWPRLHPLLIAHDVGGSRDRSTAVVGGYCWLCAGNPWHQGIQRVAAGPLWQYARQCPGAS